MKQGVKPCGLGALDSLRLEAVGCCMGRTWIQAPILPHRRKVGDREAKDGKMKKT